MRYADTRPYADPEKAARKLLEIASTIEPVQDGRIYIELLSAPFLFKEGGSPAESHPRLNWRKNANYWPAMTRSSRNRQLSGYRNDQHGLLSGNIQARRAS